MRSLKIWPMCKFIKLTSTFSLSALLICTIIKHFSHEFKLQVLVMINTIQNTWKATKKMLNLRLQQWISLC